MTSAFWEWLFVSRTRNNLRFCALSDVVKKVQLKKPWGLWPMALLDLALANKTDDVA